MKITPYKVTSSFATYFWSTSIFVHTAGNLSGALVNRDINVKFVLLWFIRGAMNS